MESNLGILTLIPPLIAIVLCFITKRVLLSLFFGVFAGGVILSSGNPLGGIVYSLDKIIGSITDEWNASLLVFNLLMGSGVAFIWRLGGSKALTDWAKKKIKTRRQAGIGTWVLGMIIFFNDYVNAAIVGNVFRDIYDEKNISREKLSYVLDSTAAPVATFFISDWIAFQIGMMQSGMETAGITGISAFEAYLSSIPFNLYSLFAVLLVGMVVIFKVDFGGMLKAEDRAYKTGKTLRDGATPMLNVKDELGEAKTGKPMLISFFGPIIILVVVSLFGFYWTGRAGGTLLEVLSNTDPAKALLWGAFAMTLVGAVIAIITKLMSITEIMETLIDGMKLMLLACSILVLAWSLGEVTSDMKLADYLTSIVGENLPFAVVPIIIFVVSMIIAFSTGTSWGAMTIITPIAIPLTYKLTNDPYLSVVMAGIVFSGSIFGDHCSPISDTTVLSSIFSGADHMDHVSTQIPFALLTAFVAGLMYLAFGLFNLSPLYLIPIGVTLLFLFTFGISGFYRKKYGIEREY